MLLSKVKIKESPLEGVLMIFLAFFRHEMNFERKRLFVLYVYDICIKCLCQIFKKS